MQQIASFFTIYKQSVWDKDAVALNNLYNAQVIIFDMWDQGVTNAAQWPTINIDWLNSLGDEKVKVNFEQVTIHESGDTGFATALIEFQAISTEGAILRGMKNRITLGFSKLIGEWKVVHQHTSAPISSDGLKAILDI